MLFVSSKGNTKWLRCAAVNEILAGSRMAGDSAAALSSPEGGERDAATYTLYLSSNRKISADELQGQNGP
jgi:hypothetical protein